MILFNSFIRWINNHKEKMIQEDLEDRMFVLVDVKIEMIDGSYVTFNVWVREKYGIDEYCKDMLYKKSITLGEYTYNTSNIIRFEHKEIEKRLIKEDIKKKLNKGTISHWDFKRVAKEEELEEVIND